MGRLLLQMMISLDGMVSGSQGQLDWIAMDEPIVQDHLARLKQAKLLILGAGVIPEMSSYWTAAEKDEKTDPGLRELGRAMNHVRKVVYSHAHRQLDWQNAELHVVKDDDAFVQDVRRLKQETQGTFITYGGVRLARSCVRHALVDEIHLDICPIVLGAGQALFSDSTPRINLRLRESATYESGATMVHYECVDKSRANNRDLERATH
jgi:dihydrofolate reductase